MLNENDLNLDLNTIAALTPSQSEKGEHAEQGELPGAPHLQTVHPGEHLSAAQIEHLMGDETAGTGPDTDS